MDTGVIYLATNNINKKQYIGQAISISSNGRKWGSKRRWQSHIKCAKNNTFQCRLLENAINKYGPENFILKDVKTCLLNDLNYYEQEYIKMYNTLAPNGYNLMSGGGNRRKHSIETRNKMSETRTNKTHTETTKQKISQSNTGITRDITWRSNTGKASKYRNISEENYNLINNALLKINLSVLPIYISMSIQRNIPAIVVRVPGKPTKKFCKKDMELNEKIRLAIEYKNSLT